MTCRTGSCTTCHHSTPWHSFCRHKGLSGGAIAGIVGAASLCSFLLGLAVFAGYQIYKARRKAQAEYAFEAALQDSGLGLDDAFEQVGLRLMQHFVLMLLCTT